MRGGLGPDGLKLIYEFVQQGGTLITEGGTASIFPNYSLTPGLRVDTDNPGLVARGTILRGIIADMGSPLVYGYAVNQLPIYFNGGPVLDAGIPEAPNATPLGTIMFTRTGDTTSGGGGGGGGGRGGGASPYQNTSPMATWVPKAVWKPLQQWPTGGGGGAGAGAGADPAGARGRGAPPGGGFAGGRGGGGGGAPLLDFMAPRIVVQFPAAAGDMLLSGVLAGGENLSNRAQVVTSPIGQGHVVMFAIRPFWRWQTQGTFMMGFNAIMNWNDLNAGR
jgi:hypothetical protein